MTFDGHIHFFDIASQGKGGLQTWSPNTIKVRMVLNYKGIKYTESFLAYPDIRPFCASFGIPDDISSERPTLPVIIHYDSHGNVVKALGNSFDIARYLDELSPERPVFGQPGGPYAAAAYAIQAALAPFKDRVWSSGAKLAVSKIPAILQPRCAAWFIEDRTRKHPRGLPPSEWPSKDGEVEWKIYEEGLSYLATLLGGSTTAPRVGEAARTQPFLLGDTPVYADFIVAGIFTWTKRASEDDFQRLLRVTKDTGELERHYQACEPWILAQGKVVEWDVENKCIAA
ncbi:hypothetical protein HDU87_004997 [Geranomyces variabilis]|uniref:GST N-terminal domain-containing protein n=1 Tax=Geranomyces variabilis TaxID=109894 RepID=A0AAD5TSK7_9FUNG|nr:hypothetical protein HDU87_004997 [Geranomyces variabilis]